MPLTRSRLALGVACLAGALRLAALAPAHADPSVITLAGQSNDDTRQGFRLTLENNPSPSPPGGAALSLGTLKLVLAAGDGKQWAYAVATPAWSYGHAYSVDAVIAGGGGAATLRLDGAPAASAAVGPVSPADAPLLASYAPNWENGLTDYAVVEQSLSVASGAARLERRFSLSPAEPAPLLFSSLQPVRDAAFRCDPAAPLTIHATFTLAPRPTPAQAAALGPLVDKYGQVTFHDWPGKIHTDADLAASAADEQRRLAAMPPAPDVDAYGGLKRAGWHLAATGYYRTVRRRGYWWLVTPTGYPCFYTGLCTAPLLSGNGTPVSGREAMFAQLPPDTPAEAGTRGTDMFGDNAQVGYVVFDTANMIAKYGPGWKAAGLALVKRRLRAWEFAGLGKWSDPVPGVPYLDVLSRAGVPTLHGLPDPFDPATRAQLAATLRAQMTPHAHDPALVGWSLGNEHDEIVTHDVILGILADAQPTPAKRALIAEAARTLYGGDAVKLAAAWKAAGGASVGGAAALPTQALTPAPADVEPLRHFFANHYYAMVYDAVRQIDPRHLYLGFWIVPYWWENASDWQLIAAHCDVLGYDNYAARFADPNIRHWIAASGKPVLCGEFGYPPDYDGQRGYGVYQTWTADPADAAARYAAWMHDASRNPSCIGCAWFEYRDEPVTGRGPAPAKGPLPIYGENYAFGVVDVADRPKWPLVTGMRAANQAAGAARLAATAAGR